MDFIRGQGTTAGPIKTANEKPILNRNRAVKQHKCLIDFVIVLLDFLRLRGTFYLLTFAIGVSNWSLLFQC
jgi:hypothetical protein